MFVNLLILLGGCVDQSLSKGSFDPEAADNGTEDTSFVAPEDTGPETVPAFYAVSATLTVLAGLPTTDGAEVTLEVVDADLQRTDCTVPLDTTGIVAGTIYLLTVYGVQTERQKRLFTKTAQRL